MYETKINPRCWAILLLFSPSTPLTTISVFVDGKEEEEKKKEEAKIAKAKSEYIYKINDRVRIIDSNSVGTIDKIDKKKYYVWETTNKGFKLGYKKNFKQSEWKIALN